jgi:transcription-repair coupling factor (superfamily II helicase)
MRLILYKRIANAPTEIALQELREEIIDRFGLLPDPAKLLFTVTELKIKATPLGIRKIDAGPLGARIEFHRQPNVDPTVIIGLLQTAPQTYRLQGPARLRILGDYPDAATRVDAVTRLLEELQINQD